MKLNYLSASFAFAVALSASAICRISRSKLRREGRTRAGAAAIRWAWSNQSGRAVFAALPEPIEACRLKD